MNVARSLAAQEFIARFGGVYEHSPWVAEQCFARARSLREADAIATLFADCVDRADDELKLALIRAHPDLAGRAAIQGELTADSNDEQSSAGIDQCTPEEFRRFQDCNERYKRKFGFPFVMAVRNSNRHDILAAFAERLDNSRQQEFNRALLEIHKIAKLRLRKLFEERGAA